MQIFQQYIFDLPIYSTQIFFKFFSIQNDLQEKISIDGTNISKRVRFLKRIFFYKKIM